jgi:hypothetical protein
MRSYDVALPPLATVVVWDREGVAHAETSSLAARE